MEQSTELMARANNIFTIKELLNAAIFDIARRAGDGYAWQRLCRHIRSYQPIDRESHSVVLKSLARQDCCYFPIILWIKTEVRAIRAQGGNVGMPLSDKVFLSISATVIMVLLVVILFTFDISMVRNLRL